MPDRSFSHPLSRSVFFCLLVVVRVFSQFCDHLFPPCVLRAKPGLGVGCVCVRLGKAQKVRKHIHYQAIICAFDRSSDFHDAPTERQPHPNPRPRPMALQTRARPSAQSHRSRRQPMGLPADLPRLHERWRTHNHTAPSPRHAHRKIRRTRTRRWRSAGSEA